MASFFIYDSINMYRADNTDAEGTSNGTTFSSGSAITNHERASDQNIGTVMTNIAQNDALQYAVGSTATADVAAVYFTGDDGVSSGTIINFHISSSNTLGSSKGNISAISSSGWAVADLTETSGTRFHTVFNGTVANVSEVLIGKKLSFEVEPDVNVQTSRDYGTQVQRSLGGVEYSINVHDAQEIFTISFQNISSTFKQNLTTMQDAIKGQGKKFLYYDGSNYHWVRLEQTMTFTEIADSRFSTQIKMRQQIQ
tara:strand:- start:140 stop:901 length:762 start_codon:yes stop_codon:yes gene_type:complete